MLVSGCAYFATEETAAPGDGAAAERAQRHVQGLRAFNDWQLTGRIAVQREDQGFSADLDWRQRGNAFDLRIAAPLNGGTFALAGDDTRVTLLTPRGEQYSAADAESLMARHLGWVIPVSGARWWVRGMPEPGLSVEHERRDPLGRWSDFAQAGWRISILDYREDGEPVLPRKLFLARDALKVRVVVRRWEAL